MTRWPEMISAIVSMLDEGDDILYRHIKTKALGFDCHDTHERGSVRARSCKLPGEDAAGGVRLGMG